MNTDLSRISLTAILKWAAGMIGCYVFAYLLMFQIASFPVKTQTHWLGPQLRFADKALDMGDFYHIDGDASWEYIVFYPLCQIWLRLNGIGNDSIPQE